VTIYLNHTETILAWNLNKNFNFIIWVWIGRNFNNYAWSHLSCCPVLFYFQANITRTNHIMWTMGTDFKYQYAHTWYRQLDKLIHYVNKVSPLWLGF